MGNKKIYDFIIVGQGIAGTVFASSLLKLNKSFVVIDSIKPREMSPSRIALGVYNPLVLKWITKVWNADHQLESLFSFCNFFENHFQTKIHFKQNIYRLLESSLDINNWNAKQSSIKLSRYLSRSLNDLNFTEKKFGQVLNSGWVDVKLMLDVFLGYIQERQIFLNKKIDYKRIIFKDDLIYYDNIICRNIVFCEGCSVYHNPFFKKAKVIPTKGEAIKIHCPNLNLRSVLHTGVLIIPLKDDIYHVGSTYDPNDTSILPTKKAIDKLTNKLSVIKKFPHKIINHLAAHRPSTEDRKPILGPSVNNKNIFIFNGLGSRGILLAPYLSEQLINHIYSNKVIESEISYKRFEL